MLNNNQTKSKNYIVMLYEKLCLERTKQIRLHCYEYYERKKNKSGTMCFYASFYFLMSMSGFDNMGLSTLTVHGAQYINIVGYHTHLSEFGHILGYYLSHVTRKPEFCICEQHRYRSIELPCGLIRTFVV